MDSEVWYLFLKRSYIPSWLIWAAFPSPFQHPHLHHFELIFALETPLETHIGNNHV
jgi:hypothetical protein